MILFIITGPPASGKSTVSNKISELFDKSALLEGDLIYHMVKREIEVPWKSERQVNLAFQNLADLSGNFLSSGFDVVLDWIVMPGQIGRIIEKIGIMDLRVYFIVLMADLDTLKNRDRVRGTNMGTRIDDLYNEFQTTDIHSHILFNHNKTAESVAREIFENSNKYEWINCQPDQHEGKGGTC